MKIKVDIDAEGVFGRSLVDLERSQIPFAASVAINQTANAVRDAWRKQLEHKLENPRPFTVNAPMVKYSKKREPEATIYLRDQAKGGRAPADYLIDQVFGGSRRHKAFETAVSHGLGLNGLVAVPGKSAAMDREGNQSTGQVRSILKGMGAGQTGNVFAIFEAAAGRQPGKLRPGIYRRVKSRGKGKPGKVRILNAFVKRGSYRARLDLFSTAKTVIARRFEPAFEKALTAAVDDAFRRAMGIRK